MRLKTLLLAGLAGLAFASPAAAQYLDEAHDHAHSVQVQPASPTQPAAPPPPPAQLADTQ